MQRAISLRHFHNNVIMQNGSRVPSEKKNSVQEYSFEYHEKHETALNKTQAHPFIRNT